MSLLTVAGAVKRFGGIRALDGVSLNVEGPGVYAVIGANGSGKSTLFNCITGFYRLDAGTVAVFGRDVTRRPPEAIARLGVVRTFQAARVFRELTVAENLLVAGADPADLTLWRPFFAPRAVARRERELRERMWAVLERIRLADQADTLAKHLSFGQQKLLELGRALMRRPRLILLDEPTAGVNPALIESLAQFIDGLRADGLTVLVIEHNMPFVMGLADRVTVLDHGVVIAEGPPEAVRTDEAVIRAYMGDAS